MKFALRRVENIVEKGENAGNQHFLLFPQCFQKASFSGSLRVGIVWQRVKNTPLAKVSTPGKRKTPTYQHFFAAPLARGQRAFVVVP